MAALARPLCGDLESISRAVGLHPEVVRRLVLLGILDAETGADGDLSFSPGQIARAARVQRLRAVFSLNYASLALVLDLLDRIDILESALRRRPYGEEDHRPWT